MYGTAAGNQAEPRDPATTTRSEAVSRSKHNGCGRAKCGVCKPHKKCPRKGAKDSQYEKPAVRKRVQQGKEAEE